MASRHDVSVLRARDGSLHELCWSEGQVLVPHSSSRRTAGHQDNARPAPALLLTLLLSHRGKCTDSLGLAQPTQSQGNTGLPSLPPRPLPGTRVLCSLVVFLHCFPTKGFSELLCMSLPPCPTPVLIWVFSLAGNTSALWGFASPVSASGVQTKCSCLKAEAR